MGFLNFGNDRFHGKNRSNGENMRGTDSYRPIGDEKPIMPAEDFAYIHERFGDDAAFDTLMDVQKGRISVKTLEKHLRDD